MSRFLKQSLMPGERVIRVGHFHYIYTITSLVIFAALAGSGWGLHLLIDRFGLIPQETMVMTGVKASMLPVYIGALIGLWIVLYRWLVKEMTLIVLTDKRFLYKRGIFSVRTEKMAVREVNYCEIRQSLLGNLLDYGRILVYTLTLDDNNIILPEIAEPHIFTSMIERVKKGEAPSPDAAFMQTHGAAAMMKNAQGNGGAGE